MDNPVIDKHGTKYWYDADGKKHRDNGPAVEWSDGDMWWYKYGLRHRDDGPAVERANGPKEWWLNNRYLTFEKWLDKVDIPNENKVMMRLQYG
jgi:hypothetical protein